MVFVCYSGKSQNDSNYETLNVASLNTNVVYDSLQQPQTSTTGWCDYTNSYRQFFCGLLRLLSFLDWFASNVGLHIIIFFREFYIWLFHTA